MVVLPLREQQFISSGWLAHPDSSHVQIFFFFNLYWNFLHTFCSNILQFSLVSQLYPTPWTAAHQAFLSITNSQSLLKLMSIESVMPSNHLILCRPLLLLPLVYPIIKVFSSESALC